MKLLKETSLFNKLDKRNLLKLRNIKDSLMLKLTTTTSRMKSSQAKTDSSISIKMQKQPKTRRNWYHVSQHYSTLSTLLISHKFLKRLLILSTLLLQVSLTQKPILQAPSFQLPSLPSHKTWWNCSTSKVPHQVLKMSRFQSQDKMREFQRTLRKNSNNSKMDSMNSRNQAKQMNSTHTLLLRLMDHSNKNLPLQWIMLPKISELDKDHPLSKSCWVRSKIN
jgi:hypothetical protein